jgi:N-methylhydantoinase A/oxoprolinase/acetone carboxylase beta subunit/tetratricopeptide (TPR) repeat protein
MSLLLGIDTGGTYTDAVLYQDGGPNPRVIAKAKALTTREDLSLGIGSVVERVLAGDGAKAGDIALASVSTTLATNALVEGQGGRVGLVFIGFAEADVDRAGLREALAGDPVIQVDGGHTPLGEPAAPLDCAALTKAVEAISGTVEAFAVVAHFGVRNPSHEIQAREAIREVTGLPVTCGHELSAQLNGPKRALTCVLNARLVGMIAELVDATAATLKERGISAPLMLVRGDGSLVTAAFARNRPIETILSGPAASLIGAAHLTGLTDAVISDIGGTTTDVAVLRGGRPELSPNGAKVGGYHTMVEAIDMVTHGLGGDSEVWFDENRRGNLPRLGPRRLIPVSLLARDYPGIVDAALQRQTRRGAPTESDGRFLKVNRRLLGRVDGLRDAERRLLNAIGDGPVAQDEVVTRRLQMSALGRLVDIGLVRISGFTPSDAAHVLGLHEGWDREAATRAADLVARQRDALGGSRATSGTMLAEQVIAAVKRRSAEVVLAAALARDGLAEVDPSTSKLVHAAIDGATGATRIDIGVKLPVIGLGASAPVYYPDVARILGAEAVIPEHADVANALGAVVGRVEIRREITILAAGSGAYRVPGHPDPRDFATLEPARDHARGILHELTRAEARAAGADDIEYREHYDEKTSRIDGKPVFIEGRMSVTATGRPRLRELGRRLPALLPEPAVADALKLLQKQVEEHGAARNWALVVERCRRMIILRPETGTPLRNHAVAKALVVGPALAPADFHRAMLVHPGASSTAHDHAVNERRRGSYPSSLRLCRWSLCLAPDQIDVYLSAGAAAFGMQDLGRAWRLFTRARAIRPDNIVALGNIVEVLTRRGHHGLIARAARRLLCADPTAPGAGAALASAWTSIARVGEAIKIARRTLLMNPLDGKLHGTLARSELKSGGYERAIGSARRYALINPMSSYALLTLAEASVNREDLSLCETSSTWLRVAASDRGKSMAAAVVNSGRPAVYVHVPKTAGSSIQRSTYAFSTSIGHRWIEQEPTEEDKHYTVWVAPNLLIRKEVLDQRYIFSNTRHLLPLLVSFYEHCRRGFSSPLMIDLLRKARTEPFGDFVRRIAGQETPWISRRFIFAPFFERSTGRFLIDWLNRTEAVDDDLPEMCRTRRFPYRGVGTLNKEVDKDWRGYYDDDLIDLAWRVWAREVAMFGYTRDGGYSVDALLHRDTSRFKPRLSYDWRDDTVRLDGKVYDGRPTGINAVAAGR